MSEIKMSYVENVPPVRGTGKMYDWVTAISELINSGHHALKLECENVNKAAYLASTLHHTIKAQAFDVIIMRRRSDVYIINKAIPAKK